MSTLKIISFRQILAIVILLFAIQPINPMAKTPAAKSEQPLAVKLIDKSIWKLTPDKGDSVLLYQSKADFIDRSSLSVSAHNSYYAVIEQIFGKYNTKESELKCRYDVLPRVVLTIYDKNGHSVDSVMDVFAYVWDNKGSRIAFTTCDFSYAEYIESHPTGLWILNIGTGKPIKIANHAENLFWAKHDGCLYYTAYTSKGDSVYKWNPTDNSIEVTNHKDVYFSPDGKYYLSLYKEDDWGKPIQLYDSNTDKRLFVIKSAEQNISPQSDSFPFPSEIGALWCAYGSGNPYGWGLNQGHSLKAT
jgi:hypothetical protein